MPGYDADADTVGTRDSRKAMGLLPQSTPQDLERLEWSWCAFRAMRSGLNVIANFPTRMSASGFDGRQTAHLFDDVRDLSPYQNAGSYFFISITIA